jgi:RNA recognition motif-containing protein
MERGTTALFGRWAPTLQSSNAGLYRPGELTRRRAPSQRAKKPAGVPRQADFMWVRNNKGNVFVGNLPPDFSDERLAEAFDPYGIVLSAIVARDPSTGARLRYGFVDIATEKAANKAIAALHGSEVGGCKLNVKPRDKAAKKPGAAGGPRSRGSAPGAPRPNGMRRDFTEAGPRLSQTAAAQGLAAPPRVAQSQSAQEKVSQTQRALEGLPEIEPPPRRDFEVVRRPVRRPTPSFQVERRPLPRRVP